MSVQQDAVMLLQCPSDNPIVITVIVLELHYNTKNIKNIVYNILVNLTGADPIRKHHCVHTETSV